MAISTTTGARPRTSTRTPGEWEPDRPPALGAGLSRRTARPTEALATAGKPLDANAITGRYWSHAPCGTTHRPAVSPVRQRADSSVALGNGLASWETCTCPIAPIRASGRRMAWESQSQLLPPVPLPPRLGPRPGPRVPALSSAEAVILPLGE